MTTLPTPPEPEIEPSKLIDSKMPIFGALYSEKQMQAYGQACFYEGVVGQPAYIVMCSKKGIETMDWFAPMSYGRGTEPAHDQLLMRGRATLFNSQKEAFDALEVTLKQAKSEGHKWPEKYTYSVVECSK